MSQQLSYSRPRSPVPGSESHFTPRSLQPLALGSGRGSCLPSKGQALNRNSLFPKVTDRAPRAVLELTEPPHFTYTLRRARSL